MTSILIEMGDIEIQIRRSTKTANKYNKKESISATPVKSPSITYQNGDQEKKNTAEEKPASNQTYWDYSVTHGKKFAFDISLNKKQKRHQIF